MNALFLLPALRRAQRRTGSARTPISHLGFAIVVLAVVAVPAVAFAQSGSPFDTGFRSLQTLFTGTVAKVASLIAIVIGGYQFAHGEPGAKRVAAGTTGTGTRCLLAGSVR
jgi:type IV secretory pathway VirB2 component (pilin)